MCFYSKSTGVESIMADSKPASPAVSSQPAGIQIILDAEKEATRLVQQARKYRLDRLKEARTEAQHEIESLKREKQIQYQKYEQQLLKELEDNRQKERVGVEERLKETERMAMEKSEQVIELLMEKTLYVNTEALPSNPSQAPPHSKSSSPSKHRNNSSDDKKRHK